MAASLPTFQNTMPIYAYKCQACGHAKDVLQKMSDPLLTECPACGKSEFQKQVTAAGFQLKGSGWYVTDFRGGNSGEGKAAESKADGKPAESGGKSETKSDTGTGAGTGTSTTPAAPAPSAAPSSSTATSSPASSGSSSATST
jgi:putative FmdB family regulatory protein